MVIEYFARYYDIFLRQYVFDRHLYLLKAVVLVYSLYIH